MTALGHRVSGSLDLIDADILTTDNLNRVSYATLAGTLAGTQKVTEAEGLVRRCCPDLAVTGYPETFDTYKQRTPRRADRIYDVMVTGLDDDQIRWEAQRDLPRILIDGATGKDMVARVERVEFGRYGCLGCSRRPMDTGGAGGRCDAAPDPCAPSLSFLSSYPGILAAGELIKEAMGTGQLRGHFNHVFRYGPNPDLAGTPRHPARLPGGLQPPLEARPVPAEVPRRTATPDTGSTRPGAPCPVQLISATGTSR